MANVFELILVNRSRKGFSRKYQLYKHCHTVQNPQRKVILAICHHFLTYLRFTCDELVEVVAVRGTVSDLIIPNIPVTLPEGLQVIYLLIFT